MTFILIIDIQVIDRVPVKTNLSIFDEYRSNAVLPRKVIPNEGLSFSIHSFFNNIILPSQAKYSFLFFCDFRLKISSLMNILNYRGIQKTDHLTHRQMM